MDNKEPYKLARAIDFEDECPIGDLSEQYTELVAIRIRYEKAWHDGRHILPSLMVLGNLTMHPLAYLELKTPNLSNHLTPLSSNMPQCSFQTIYVLEIYSMIIVRR
ncbi:hypothetical protein ACJX0J_030364 [Zea mays]